MHRGCCDALEGVYIGGGTPTVLEKSNICIIMEQVQKIYGLADRAEITIEANPGTLTKKYVKEMLKTGINRISIGVQSLIDAELSLLGRSHNSAGALAAINSARDGGFSNISLDLIYGIPGQRIASWKQTLETIVSYNPEHLSVYELTPEKNTWLYAELQCGRLSLPDEDTVSEMYYSALELLEDQGYTHYEISNFARPGYECRHNLNYWNRGQYLGVGAGAHSFIKGCRRANYCDAEAYVQKIIADELPVAEELLLSEQDQLEEALFLGLRKMEGIDTVQFPKWAIEQMGGTLHELVSEGLVEPAGNNIRLTRKGLLVCNAVNVRLMLSIEQRHPV